MHTGSNVPNLISQIESRFSNLTRAELRVAVYISKNSGDVIHQSISELANMSKASEATVVRTCKKLGFSSYQEFKVLLAQAIVSPNQIANGNIDIDECHSVSDVIKCVFESTIQTLQLTQKATLSSPVEQAADLLYNAGCVFIIGMGNSSAIALDLQHKLLRLGILAIAQSDSHLQRIMITTRATPSDVVFAISHSGSTKDILENVKIGREKGAKIIALTAYGKTPLSNLSDVHLYTLSNETNTNPTSVSSRIAQMGIVDVLHTVISYKHKDVIEKIKDLNMRMSYFKG